ncbi:hypothetical protein BX600DRAFT_385303, partial [Xylariales sp. PMI_506]
KRARRRHGEVERFYRCNYPGCDKGYGRLGHLNTHVTLKNHGTMRNPSGKSRNFLDTDSYSCRLDRIPRYSRCTKKQKKSCTKSLLENK